MFEYFSRSYPWNLGVMYAMFMGAHLSDVDDASRPLLVLDGDSAEAQETWMHSWIRVAERAEQQGRDDLAGHRRLSAARKLRRAAVYFFIAERMPAPHDPRREVLYERALSHQRARSRTAGVHD